MVEKRLDLTLAEFLRSDCYHNWKEFGVIADCTDALTKRDEELILLSWILDEVLLVDTWFVSANERAFQV